jgi:ergothioneine biosynthesis protein EgtB
MTKAGPETLDIRAAALERYRAVRAVTERLAAPLCPEDQVVQSMDDVSPTKWHRAHVTWFFETLLLTPYLSGYAEFHPQFAFLFNSYYKALGPHHARPRRGLLSRPTVAEVGGYRAHVDRAMADLIANSAEADWTEIAPVLELGLNHEQQHQELLLTDIKHVLSCNPLAPVYDQGPVAGSGRPGASAGWVGFEGGLVETGHGGGGFAYDNECPRHKVHIEPYRIGSRPVTNGEYGQFMEDGGYAEPAHWLSDGWATVGREGWDAPLYWRRTKGGSSHDWSEFTLAGEQPLDPDAPVCHVSFYEADAYASWSEKRLATEAEWEAAASASRPGGDRAEGNFLDDGRLRPVPAKTDADGSGADGLDQMFGDVWEWTRSAYTPYPGFRATAGAAREYNGKFMSGQMVLRGGSCATPADHIRSTYRNFFYPRDRWQFSGIRLADEP